jgi:hypothetical protein
MRWAGCGSAQAGSRTWARPGPHRKATTDPRDIRPETGRARLGYDRARVLLAHYGDGLRLHQLRHSAATHLGEANVSASVIIMAKPGTGACAASPATSNPAWPPVHEATETLSVQPPTPRISTRYDGDCQQV